eukprot:gene6243-2865_t
MTTQLIGPFGSLLPGEYDRPGDSKEGAAHGVDEANARAMDSRRQTPPFSNKEFEELINRGGEEGIAPFPSHDWLGPLGVVPGLSPLPPNIAPRLLGRTGKTRKPKQRNQHSGSTSVQKVCGNCGTSVTPLWRKEAGVSMCNACGIYFKNHGYHRPVELILGPSSRQNSSQGRAGGAAGHAISGQQDGGKPSRLATPAPSSEAHTDMPHQHYHLDTATSQPTSNLGNEVRSKRRQSSDGGRGSAGFYRNLERGGGRGGLDSTGPSPPSAVGSAMEGPPLAAAQEEVLGAGEMSDPGSGAFDDDGHRRSSRRRAVRRFGDEWCEPDEVVHPTAGAATATRSQLSGGGGRSRNGTDCESDYQQRRFYRDSPSWEGTGQGGLPPGSSPSADGGGAAMLQRLRPPGHAAAWDSTFGGFERAGVFPAISICPMGLAGLPRCDTPHLPLVSLGNAPLVGPPMDEGPDLNEGDGSEVVAATLVRLRHTLLEQWMSGAHDQLDQATPHFRDMHDVSHSPSASLMPSPYPYNNMDYDQEYPSDSHMSDGATESIRVAAANRRRQRPSAGKQRKRAPSSSRASPGASRGSAGGGTNVCFNCGTTRTPLWRKDRETGETMCNACGIYKQTHGFPRPVDVSHRGDSPSRMPPKYKALQEGALPGADSGVHEGASLLGQRQLSPSQQQLSPPRPQDSSGSIGGADVHWLKKQVAGKGGRPPLPPPTSQITSLNPSGRPLGGGVSLEEENIKLEGGDTTRKGPPSPLGDTPPGAAPSPNEAVVGATPPTGERGGAGVVGGREPGTQGSSVVAELLAQIGLLSRRPGSGAGAGAGGGAGMGGLAGARAHEGQGGAATAPAAAPGAAVDWHQLKQLYQIKQLHLLALDQQQLQHHQEQHHQRQQQQQKQKQVDKGGQGGTREHQEAKPSTGGGGGGGGEPGATHVSPDHALAAALTSLQAPPGPQAAVSVGEGVLEPTRVLGPTGFREPTSPSSSARGAPDSQMTSVVVGATSTTHPGSESQLKAGEGGPLEKPGPNTNLHPHLAPLPTLTHRSSSATKDAAGDTPAPSGDSSSPPSHLTPPQSLVLAGIRGLSPSELPASTEASHPHMHPPAVPELPSFALRLPETPMSGQAKPPASCETPMSGQAKTPAS